ncbi:hypothetical protein GMDG_08264 [Pseudogymnoascus destructans 20631-21]|uniref:DNA ligase n=1 Tax=Pseudogymnoascus destructans (strain ATCC MYA-4855 / 20631-21) TaxID=658429 RepID=L8G1W6_PSED2|nr:hypothetical protein GMDG_08264 [Pseudogymnoascus destructans 20631-21]
MSSQRAPRHIDKEAREDDDLQYGHGPLSKEELEAKYPNRPLNQHKTLPFHELLVSLFTPLSENKKKPTGPSAAGRAKRGPHGPTHQSPHGVRRIIIERFISRWRSEVGHDFYPALRLIIPEKDRDRAMYGLKEKTIGRLLVKLMKINKNSEDGYNLLNWKLPGQTFASRMAGDFAGRCFEVLSKRPMRTSMGNMRIAEVNQLLDQLSSAPKEEAQLPIFQIFYNRMNADELMWLIRVILRQMKVGASEKTFLDLWHPDGETLFNVSSSLRRVCWELTDPSIRLEGNETGVTLMQCFQPQLAQFQMHSFHRMVDNMRPTPEDTEFWIEEKLDGERMQMHMVEDDSVPGGRRFGFWSRKAKDYTYLYGSGFEDENGAITSHLKKAFDSGVRNLILDGEMITWDPEADIMVPFGTLKTAALSEQRNPFAGNGPRPLFRIFDIIYLNDEPLTQYTLRDRRRALERCITNVHRRFEVHSYNSAHSVEAIEPLLRKVVAEASEGLVLKNPRSIYRLNSRNDDWMKVKPEYMTGFGESLDCIVIGGYYGSGHRGGRLSSFLCGLRVDQNHIQKGADPMKCYSFFKVGGGFKAEDYANIRHHTENKWVDWDPRKPPIPLIELAGGEAQFERPDVWIRPCDSVVVSVKAASVCASDSFRVGLTLRFPRFKHLRMDRDWSTSLSIQEFIDLKSRLEDESREKEFTVDTRRKAAKTSKKQLLVAGNDNKATKPYAGQGSDAFHGLNFCVLSEATKLPKKSKVELEQYIKANGGSIFQSPTTQADTIVIADKKVVKVASLMKSGLQNVVRPRWLFDAVLQYEADPGRETHLVLFEPRHMFYTVQHEIERVQQNVDRFGDSYARDVGATELKEICDNMPKEELESGLETDRLLSQLQGGHHDLGLRDMKGFMFSDFCAHIAGWQRSEEVADLSEDGLRCLLVEHKLRFGLASIKSDLEDTNITHIVVQEGLDRLKSIREKISHRRVVPRIITLEWVEDSWREGTLLDEDRYAPGG